MSERVCQAPDCGKSIAHKAPQARYCDNACNQRASRQQKSDRRGHCQGSLAGQVGYFDALDSTRGYLTGWRPRRKTEILVGQVGYILEEYREQLPLTCRQIYYRMVAEFKHPKGKLFERALYDALQDARRAEHIPFDAIRDDGIMEKAGWWPRDAGAVIEDWDIRAEWFLRDMQEGQPVRLQVWCESAGMVPQLATVARPYSIPVYSCGGFISLTAVRTIVEWCRLDDRPTVLLHLGDCDPSGYSIFQALQEDVSAFLAEDDPEVGFTAERVALRLDQLEGLDVDPDEVSKDPKDTRAASWRKRGLVHQAQLEALAPNKIAELLTEAIERHRDREVMAKVEQAQKADRIYLAKSVAAARIEFDRVRDWQSDWPRSLTDETTVRVPDYDAMLDWQDAS